jgi:Na+-translocating ferredoxin:NAD+ oxidoreductase RnfD subunit
MTDGNSTPITPRGRLIHGQAAGLLCVSFAALTYWSDIAPVLAAILLLLSAAAPLVDQVLQPPPHVETTVASAAPLPALQ